MNKFKNYEQFNESVHATLMKDPSKIVYPILRHAKRTKQIKRGTKFYPDTHMFTQPWIANSEIYHELGKQSRIMIIDGENFNGYNCSYVQLNDNKVLLVDTSGNDVKNFKFAFFSYEPFDIKNLEFMNEEVTASHFNKIFTYSVDLVNDFSEEIGTIKQEKGWPSEVLDIDIYYVIYEFKIVDTKEVTITNEEIEELPEYKDLFESLPVSLKSSPLQKEKLTYWFSIKADDVIFAGDKTDYLPIRDNEEWIDSGYVLYVSGYIRYISSFGNFFSGKNTMTPVGEFDSTNIDGWKKGLKKVKSLFIKCMKVGKLIPIGDLSQEMLIDYVNDKVITWDQASPFLSKENRHKYRGKIGAYRFKI
jgi:hypothetical protein